MCKIILQEHGYSKVDGYKVDILQNSIAFWQTNNEQVGFEIKNIMPFILVLTKIKYLGIGLSM